MVRSQKTKSSMLAFRRMCAPGVSAFASINSTLACTAVIDCGFAFGIEHDRGDVGPRGTYVDPDGDVNGTRHWDEYCREGSGAGRKREEGGTRWSTDSRVTTIENELPEAEPGDRRDSTPASAA